MNAYLDRSFTHLHRLADFAQTESIIVGEREDHAVSFGQFCQPLLDDDTPPCGFAIGIPVEIFYHLERDRLRSFRLPEVIAHDIARDRTQPWLEMITALHFLDIRERLDKSLLSKVLARVIITCHAPHDREHQPFVNGDEPRDRLLITILRIFDQTPDIIQCCFQ